MVTRLWWVRHGPTHQTVMTGWRDVPCDLSDTAALDRLRAALPAAPVVSSDLLRARQTADALCGNRPRLADDAALREMHHGAWEGLGWQDIAARWPDLSRRCWEDPGEAAPPDGESWNACALRVGAAADRLCTIGPDIIVVAHMAAILTQVARARGLSPAAAIALPVAPLSVTCLRRDGAQWRAESVNGLP